MQSSYAFRSVLIVLWIVPTILAVTLSGSWWLVGTGFWVLAVTLGAGRVLYQLVAHLLTLVILGAGAFVLPAAWQPWLLGAGVGIVAGWLISAYAEWGDDIPLHSFGEGIRDSSHHYPPPNISSSNDDDTTLR